MEKFQTVFCDENFLKHKCNGLASKRHMYLYFLVMEAATFSDKLFTGTLILLTVVGIFVLFWFRNFGPGFRFMHVSHL